MLTQNRGQINFRMEPAILRQAAAIDLTGLISAAEYGSTGTPRPTW
jgi:hypothetical protein